MFWVSKSRRCSRASCRRRYISLQDSNSSGFSFLKSRMQWLCQSSSVSSIKTWRSGERECGRKHGNLPHSFCLLSFPIQSNTFAKKMPKLNGKLHYPQISAFVTHQGFSETTCGRNLPRLAGGSPPKEGGSSHDSMGTQELCLPCTSSREENLLSVQSLRIRLVPPALAGVCLFSPPQHEKSRDAHHVFLS